MQIKHLSSLNTFSLYVCMCNTITDKFEYFLERDILSKEERICVCMYASVFMSRDIESLLFPKTKVLTLSCPCSYLYTLQEGLLPCATDILNRQMNPKDASG